MAEKPMLTTQEARCDRPSLVVAGLTLLSFPVVSLLLGFAFCACVAAMDPAVGAMETAKDPELVFAAMSNGLVQHYSLAAVQTTGNVFSGNLSQPSATTRWRRNAALKDDVTFEERVAFVRRHNDFRSSVSPVATDMMFMTWNTELASMAQEWADNCDFSHGNPVRDPAPFSYVGQNLYVTSGQSVSVDAAVTAWHSEVTNYDYPSRSCSGVCGHYTQMIWADSHSVGCGITQCNAVRSFGNRAGVLVVCNYGPGGNYVGSAPYRTGVTSCSACPADHATCDNNLCVRQPKCGDLRCDNGGRLLEDVCLCQCGDGRAGTTCSAGSQFLAASWIHLAMLLLYFLFGNLNYAVSSL